MIELDTKHTFVIIAAVGGVAKHLSEYLKGSTFRMRQLIANTIVSGFSGYVFAEAAYQLNPEWSHVAAGVGGYMGAQALDFVFYVIKERFDKNKCQVDLK